MGRAEDEPERPAVVTPAAPGRRAGGRLLVLLVVVGAAAVVLSAALGGRAHLTPFSFGTQEPIERSPASEPSLGEVPPPAGRLGSSANTAVQTLLAVLACLLAIGLAVLLIRLVITAIRRRRRIGPRRLPAAGSSDAPDVADAPAVLRGIAAALVALEEHREPGDAVVQAWLGLQQAAEEAGLPRSPSETPTEFTGRVLSTTGADRKPLRTLLGLYLRARFADAAITAADADTARAALRALETSWERVTAAGRG